jgi:hypothetical protein
MGLALAGQWGYGSLLESSDRVVSHKLACTTDDKALASTVLSVPLLKVVELGGG